MPGARSSFSSKILGSAALAIFAAGALGGCSPPTDLFDQARGAGADAGISASPQVVLLEPSPGSVAPQNLAGVVLRFAAPLREEGGAPPARLRPEVGPSIALGPATAIDCRGGLCYQFAAPAGLIAGRYVAEAPLGAFFADGRPVPGDLAGAFRVEAALDQTPPLIGPALGFEVVGDCLQVRLTTDEPARATATVRTEAAQSTFALGEGAVAYDVATRLGALPAGAPAELVVRVVDWAGNRSESPPLPLHVPAASVPLVITEVLTNPVGAEATQEFVEIRNLGSEPLPLGGVLIEDATGSDPLPAVTLPPGAYALVVAAAFDAAEGRDPAPREGTPLLRVPGRIGRDGLGNAGELVQLRDKSGQVVSRYGGWVDTNGTAWAGRSVRRESEGACDEATAWTTRPAVPTPGW